MIAILTAGRDVGSHARPPTDTMASAHPSQPDLSPADARVPADAGPGTDGTAFPLPTPAFSPLYQQIKSLILRSLQAGEWKPGELIPSEIELAARFKVSQGTVRKAIDELSAENLVVRRQDNFRSKIQHDMSNN